MLHLRLVSALAAGTAKAVDKLHLCEESACYFQESGICNQYRNAVRPADGNVETVAAVEKFDSARPVVARLGCHRHQDDGFFLTFEFIDLSNKCADRRHGPKQIDLLVDRRLLYLSAVINCLLLPSVRLRSRVSETALHGRLLKPIIGSLGANDCQRMELHIMYNLERLFRLKTVLNCTDRCRSTMVRTLAKGTFPGQIKFDVHRSGWRVSAFNRWIENRV